MMTKEMILNAIENNDFEFYGLRYDFNNYNLNDTCENSHQWFDAWNLDNFDKLTDEELDERFNSEMMCYDNGELNGTCSIQVTEETIDKVLEHMKKFYEPRYSPEGAKLILIAGDFAEEGNDRHEIIIENAVVIAK